MSDTDVKIKLSDFQPLIDKAEFQKTYLFKIVLPAAVDIGQYNAKIKVKDFIQYCTSSTSFPVSQTDNQAISYFNSEFKIAKKTTYSNWQATFRYNIQNSDFVIGNISFPGADISSSPLNCYEYFNYWRNTVFWENDRVSSLPKDYKKNFDLLLLNEQGQPYNYFTLIGAWPTQISGGNLDYSTDNILTFTVDFAFDRFVFTSVTENLLEIMGL